jgi:cytidylate kinase
VARAELRGVVALDGPSGTGKSTVARQLATGAGAAYLDTGAMYRAVTWAVLQAGADPGDPVEVERVARTSELRIGTDAQQPWITVDGRAVDREIRGPEVTAAVSAVSAVPALREVLVAEQRRIVQEALDGPGGIVVEGRDIGTAVVPDARLKVYLTASDDARAERRNTQDSAAGRPPVDLASTRADVRRRDAHDSSRTASPLRKAEDAVELDTTDLDVPGVLEQLRKLAECRGLLAEGSLG